MAFVLVLAGLVLFVTALQGTANQLGTMLVQDVFGTQGNRGFLYWVVAIAVVGAIGYVKSLKGLSDAFLALLLLVLFLNNKGFFAQFNSAIGQIGSQANAIPLQQSSLPNLPSLPTNLFGTPQSMPFDITSSSSPSQLAAYNPLLQGAV